MIFISHNYNDKPVVEQIALRLREVFGQDKVFYDSWSIQPGDGIIDKMNEGIGDCELFLFCVSKNSLQSKMVSLEWQNALIKATKGQTKIIPIKMDDCLMPPILLQSLYIDLFGQGLEVALRQVMDITSGNNTYQSGPQQFSNLRAYKRIENEEILIDCHAEHFMEPISNFLFLTKNTEEEMSLACTSENSFTSGFNKDLSLNNGQTYNAFLIGISRGTVPGFPLSIKATLKNDSSGDIVAVMHEDKKDSWRVIPLIDGKKE